MENKITLSKRVEGKSRLWVTLLLLCFCNFTWAQVKVTGVVTDPSGEAIIGANIVEKGVPGNGTISDILKCKKQQGHSNHLFHWLQRQNSSPQREYKFESNIRRRFSVIGRGSGSGVRLRKEK